MPSPTLQQHYNLGRHKTQEIYLPPTLIEGVDEMEEGKVEAVRGGMAEVEVGTYTSVHTLQTHGINYPQKIKSA
jgi:hypothetical protein